MKQCIKQIIRNADAARQWNHQRFTSRAATKAINEFERSIDENYIAKLSPSERETFIRNRADFLSAMPVGSQR